MLKVFCEVSASVMHVGKSKIGSVIRNKRWQFIIEKHIHNNIHNRLGTHVLTTDTYVYNGTYNNVCTQVRTTVYGRGGGASGHRMVCV